MAFGRNLSRGALHKFLCSVQHHSLQLIMLVGCSGTCFQEIVKDNYICCTLKIRLLCIKSDFAALKSSEGLASLETEHFATHYWSC